MANLSWFFLLDFQENVMHFFSENEVFGCCVIPTRCWYHNHETWAKRKIKWLLLFTIIMDVPFLRLDTSYEHFFFFDVLVFKTTHNHCMSIFRGFLVRIFSHSSWIRRDTEYLSVFSPNVEKYGPEKLRILTLFTQWISLKTFSCHQL